MKQPLRVLYVLNSPRGGATRGILELLSGLPAERCQGYAALPVTPNDFQRDNLSRLTRAFHVVPMSWWNRKTQLPLLSRLRVWGGEKVHTLGHVRSVWQLRHLIQAWQIDLVYTNTAMILDGALAARFTARPHLWHIKEQVGRRARVRFPLPDPFLRGVFMGLSDRVLVMSRFIGRFFEHDGPTDRLDIVNDGVDLSNFTGDLNGRAVRRGLGVSDDQLLVGMVASSSAAWKNHSLFIQMAARLADQFPQVRFAVFGSEPKYHTNSAYNRPWEYYQGIKKQVRELGLEMRFIWAGFCQSVPQMMDAIDVVVHPCDIEPFGRIAIEAMAARKPVVGPDCGGIAESVVDGKTGFLVTAGDAEAFARATARLLQDRALRRGLGKQGRQHVAAHFSLQRHVNQILSIYDNVVRA